MPLTLPSHTSGHQRPREEWIEIPVPALVTEETFARTQELLYQNKIRSRRRTIAPSVVQGLVGCAKCGYALSRTSTQTSARKIHYYSAPKLYLAAGVTKVLASLNTPCPKCGYLITPAEIKRITWDEIECPACGEQFDPAVSRKV